MAKPDVYIKNEGFADFRFMSDKAKDIAHKEGIPNSLKEVGSEFAWNSETKEGAYRFGIDIDDHDELVEFLKEKGLTVESEYE